MDHHGVNGMNHILTPQQAADYLNIHVGTVYRLAKCGKIPCRKVGGSWRFRRDTIDEWLLGNGKSLVKQKSRKKF